MNFLDYIWLIPLFPLFGAALMLMIGKALDPQPESATAIAPGVERVPDEHGHAHSHGQGHDHQGHHHSSPLKALVKILCPGMVLLSFIFSLGAVIELAGKAERVHQVIQFTWLAGLPFQMADGRNFIR